MTLVVRETFGEVRLARPGRLLPWLGPAVRGLTGGRLRAHVCRWPVADVLARWERCAGCPAMSECAYGETYEPDPPAGVTLLPGWENTARPITFGVSFPTPELATAGERFGVQITAVGQTAIAHLDDVWESFRVAGADLGLGLGGDHIPFDVAQVRPPTDTALSLPEPAGGGVIPRVRVALTAPLFLAETGADRRKRVVREPTLGQLMRAGLRTLGALHRLYGDPLPEEWFKTVKAASEAVPTLRLGFAEFGQGRVSNRSKERYELAGVVGWGEYGPVPEWLLPWTEWAGRLRVGTHRIAGAGGWAVET